ncbi:hypothetical protein ACIBCT_35255 [Streptosporangium sp. NPDC050855]|uniref:hypothetical protein n=1 Tax=Streptosporangium sp. NPDC050855 TaxID=3366194 RepID=UPI0037B65BF9
MIVTALWFGGNGSYSLPDADSVEQFTSITHAINTFRERAETSGAFGLPTYFVNRENSRVCFPAVGEDCTMDVYIGRAGETANYPDFRLALGPRGGVKRESYV